MVRIISFLIFVLISIPHDAIARAECPKEIGNEHECNLYREQRLLEKYPATFKRDGGKLTIFKGYTSRYYCDTIASSPFEDSSEFGAYALTNYFPGSGYAIIKNIGHERGHTIILNLKTGHEYITDGDVIESPDKRAFFVWNNDIDEYAGQNQLEILRLTPYGPVREYFLKPRDWAAKSAAWNGNNKIRVSIEDGTGNVIGAKLIARSKNSRTQWIISDIKSQNTFSITSHDRNQ